MMSIDARRQVQGLSLEGEYYRRWLSNFTGVNTGGIADITDNGYQLQSSAMVVPKDSAAVSQRVADLRRLRRPVGSARRRELVLHEGARPAPQRRVDPREHSPGRIHGRIRIPVGANGHRVPHQPRDELLIRRGDHDSQILLARRPTAACAAVGAVLPGRRPRAPARRTGARGRQRVQRLALPPDQLRPAGHRRPRVPARSWARASAARRSSAFRCSSSGRTRNSGDFAPTYYLQSDAPLYYYSFTDAYIASVYRSLTPAEQARFDPMCGTPS